MWQRSLYSVYSVGTKSYGCGGQIRLSDDERIFLSRSCILAAHMNILRAIVVMSSWNCPLRWLHKPFGYVSYRLVAPRSRETPLMVDCGRHLTVSVQLMSLVI